MKQKKQKILMIEGASVPEDALGHQLRELNYEVMPVNNLTAAEKLLQSDPSFSHIVAGTGQLKSPELSYGALFYNSHSPMMLLRPGTGEIVDVNQAACNLYGWSKEELLQMKMQTINQLSEAEVLEEMRQAKAEQRDQFFFRHKTADGTVKDVKVSSNPVTINGEKLLYSIINDITDQKRAEDALRDSEENLKITLNSIGDGVIATDVEGNVIRMNPVAEQLTGCNLKDATGRPLEEVFNIINGDTRRRIENPVKRVLATGQIVGLANHTVLISADGTEYHIADSAAPIRDREGNVSGVVLIFRDFTEEYKKNRQIKESEQKLKEALRQQEILVKEIHHRVKNNLNIVVSLLKLQRDEIDSVDKAKEAFDESMKRIYSMALIHESLYRRDKLSEVEMDTYISAMVDQIKYSFSSVSDIEYILDLDKIYLDITKAVPCGIIINELITNAAKHAFSHHAAKKIVISLKWKDEAIQLCVSDNGVGLPADFSLQKTSSLGMSLVNILIKQLEGTISVSSEGGAAFTLQFSN